MVSISTGPGSVSVAKSTTNGDALVLMSLDGLIDRFKLNITGILHVGAHHAEELEAYTEAGVPSVVWVEADEAAHQVVAKRVKDLAHHTTVRALLDEHCHQVEFHVANNGQSSSILEFGTHLKHHPEVTYIGESKMSTSTIDLLFKDKQWSSLNFWNLDVQGVELRVLKGGTVALSGCDYIYTEVNDEEVYVGGALIGELDEYLCGFERVATAWTPYHWGDALYIRKGLL
jgi:FkbM family methyltransferase